MTTSFIARIPTPVQYGYLEVHTEGQPGQPPEQVQAEFAEAVAYAEDYAKTLSGNGVTPQQAVANLQSAGVVPQGQAGTGLPQVSGPPPWSATTPQEQQSFIPPNAPQDSWNAGPAQGQQQWQPSQQQPAQGQGPTCQHGPAKYVPAGVSKSSGKPYQAFWACQAPQGQQKCKF
jgi:hypothetical protein